MGINYENFFILWLIIYDHCNYSISSNNYKNDCNIFELNINVYSIIKKLFQYYGEIPIFEGINHKKWQYEVQGDWSSGSGALAENGQWFIVGVYWDVLERYYRFRTMYFSLGTLLHIFTHGIKGIIHHDMLGIRHYF